MQWRAAGVGIAAALIGAAAVADEAALPLWEAGLAGGAGRVPDYPGADRSRTRAIVLPMLIYRGPVLRIDEGGIRGRLFDSPDWDLDLSATAAFDAQDNARRAGMPPLDYLFGVGPQWIYKGLRAGGAGPTLHLKLRALMSTDLKRLDGRGASFDPELRWRFAAPSGARWTLSLQPTWASRPLHRYFYEVDPTQATASRPAWRAHAGYLGTEAAATWSRRSAPGLSWFVTVRALSLHGSANAGSPLLRERGNLSFGAGVVWTPWRSRRPAPGG